MATSAADEDVRVLVERFYERLWNAWDDEAVDTTLAEGFVFRGSLGAETTGRAGWRAYRDEIRRGSPDFDNEIVELIAGADRAAVRLRFTGTHIGPFLDVPGTGRRFSYDGAAFFQANAGLLVAAWVLGDREGLRQQLTDQRSVPGARPSSRK